MAKRQYLRCSHGEYYTTDQLSDDPDHPARLEAMKILGDFTEKVYDLGYVVATIFKPVPWKDEPRRNRKQPK